jgi:hypothetical protein
LIEHIDNANDMEKLKLWEPLQSLLTAETSTPDIQTQAIWVIGTALQNNPSAQDVYLSKNPLPVLLSFLDPSTSTSASTRAKALYALSGLLKHNAPAVQVLDQPGIDGWTKIANSLQGEHFYPILPSRLFLGLFRVIGQGADPDIHRSIYCRAEESHLPVEHSPHPQ